MTDKSTAEPITTEQIGEIVRIVDPELDVEAILAEIRANLASRGPLDPDPASFVYKPGDAASISGHMEVEWHVEQAADYSRTLAVGEQLRPSLGPIGRVTTRLKRPLHQLVRYYVDLLAQRQSTLETHVVGALRGLAARAVTTDDEVAKLRQEVEELRRQVAALQANDPSADGSSAR